MRVFLSFHFKSFFFVVVVVVVVVVMNYSKYLAVSEGHLAQQITKKKIKNSFSPSGGNPSSLLCACPAYLESVRCVQLTQYDAKKKKKPQLDSRNYIRFYYYINNIRFCVYNNAQDTILCMMMMSLSIGF